MHLYATIILSLGLSLAAQADYVGVVTVASHPARHGANVRRDAAERRVESVFWSDEADAQAHPLEDRRARPIGHDGLAAQSLRPPLLQAGTPLRRSARATGWTPR